ncbi:hypothetical protein T09_3545 [Trichinella sp. T9]|nr:hypothetical protein T09_3545 [Trichinella sp. T9]
MRLDWQFYRVARNALKTQIKPDIEVHRFVRI